MPKTHLDTLERPLFSVRVHAKRHAGTSSQCGQKQLVRIRSPVMARIGRLVRLEAVLSNSYGLKKNLVLGIYDDSSGHISTYVCAQETILDLYPTARCWRAQNRSRRILLSILPEPLLGNSVSKNSIRRGTL